MRDPPKSAQRTAEFKAVARDLVMCGGMGLSAGISHALEAAYRRGHREALNGVPNEPDTSAFLPWLQIPARARGVFGRWCHNEKAGRARVGISPYVALLFQVRGRTARGDWRILEYSAASAAYVVRAHDDRVGVTTVQQLVDRDLMRVFLHSEGRTVAVITDYGLETFDVAVAAGEAW